jgi:Na+(H+)/acetate symporter ActP
MSTRASIIPDLDEAHSRTQLQSVMSIVGDSLFTTPAALVLWRQHCSAASEQATCTNNNKQQQQQQEQEQEQDNKKEEEQLLMFSLSLCVCVYVLDQCSTSVS